MHLFRITKYNTLSAIPTTFTKKFITESNQIVGLELEVNYVPSTCVLQEHKIYEIRIVVSVFNKLLCFIVLFPQMYAPKHLDLKLYTYFMTFRHD